ncbi:MAG: sensor histidine kinase [Calditrichaeota bacterium]|nr:MAG: sensor histidine kinase [Calditrichota bacterium]MBL1206142.1 sensor histidine kinase [Calditrichota bacterium]NOG45967.1 HAMP domain-containing histidine kinase [Calditrichota bacterium]
MQLDKQKALILQTSDETAANHLTAVLSELDIPYKERQNFDDLRSVMYEEKFETLILFIQDIESKELASFFKSIDKEKETLLIFGIGPKHKTKPVYFDFYITDEEIIDSVTLYPVLEGIFEITQKVKNQSELSSMLIHDMRSPMQSILSYLELLQGEVFGVLNDGQQQMIKNSLRLQDQILDMLNELGDVMRFENKTFQLFKSKFKVKELLQEVVQALWIQADKKNIKFSISISDEERVIFADRLALNRVFTNVLSNAIRFSPKNGAVRIDCLCSHSTDGKTSCQVKITDSGPGIKEEDAALIFDKFYRIRRLKTSKGFGLGLYVSRLFVEAHGGKIGVYNNREGGSTFHFQIPVL